MQTLLTHKMPCACRPTGKGETGMTQHIHNVVPRYLALLTALLAMLGEIEKRRKKLWLVCAR